METTDLSAQARAAGNVQRTSGSARALLLGTFVVAIFASAALLFMVQPMFTKMVLPRFGGTPAVWSVAMVFFQTALLAGYAYAHGLVRHARARASVVIHVAVMLAACSALPISIAAGWSRPPPAGEAWWLIGLFAASIGLPFFALAANSPLLQAWFARTDHPAAADPYFLYAASNVGSFLALVSYPVVIEPFVRLGDQALLWSVGFCALIALIIACGALLWRSPGEVAESAPGTLADTAAPGWRDVAFWVLLSAVPAGLLVAVTAHISTDVASIPLLWVLPLSLYLLTFVIAFQRRPIVPHWLVVEVQPLFIVALMAVIIFDPESVRSSIVVLVAVHVAVFFVCALVCHGELARRRPAPRYLTSFYMWMSAGGVIGGVTTGLIAPHVFNWVAEYPILIALAVLCRPGLALPRDLRLRYALYAALAATAVVLALCLYDPITLDLAIFNWTAAALLAACVLVSRWPVPFAAIVAFALLASRSILEPASATFVRSFFGVAKVSETTDGQFRLLQHGTTLHGGQRIRDAGGRRLTGRPEQLLYYWDGSAIAQTFDAVRAQVAGPIRFAVIGLGAGTLACRAGPDDTVHYYEIDPAIVRIARDPSLFTFLSVCRPDTPITLGDARLTLEDAPDAGYDLIVVDAFSSDAIPIHLLTREAMAIYLRKLRARGMVVMHVSNRHLELASVVAGIAAANGLTTRVNDSMSLDEVTNRYKFVGTIAAVARREADFGRLAQAPDWERRAPDPRQWVWTDDYSNVVGSLLRHIRAR